MSAFSLPCSLRRERTGLATALALTCALVLTVAAGVARAQSSHAKPPPSVGEKLSEALVQLRPLQEAKDLNAMVAVLDRVPGIKPGSYDDALILDMKARIYGMMEQPAKALELWDRALQLSDQHGYFPERQTLEVVLLLAQLHGREAATTKEPARRQEHFTKAVKHFRRYLDQTPNPAPEIMVNYTSILFYKATADPAHADPAALQEARSLVERGLTSAVKPRDEFYQLLLGLLQQENDLAHSAEVLELLLKAKPDKKDYWQVLAAIYVQLSEKAKETEPLLAREYLVRAVVTFERARALGFLNGPKDNLHLVSLHLMANQFTKGTELLQQGLKSGTIESTPENWRLLGRYFQEANLYDQAAAVLQEAAKLFPQNGEIEMQLAQLYMQMEKSADTLRHAKAAAEKGHFEGTKPFSVYHLIAYTAFDLGQLDEAQKAIVAAEAFPDDAAKDAQFPRLKAAIHEAIEGRDLRSKTKDEKTPDKKV